MIFQTPNRTEQCRVVGWRPRLTEGRHRGEISVDRRTGQTPQGRVDSKRESRRVRPTGQGDAGNRFGRAASQLFQTNKTKEWPDEWRDVFVKFNELDDALRFLLDCLGYDGDEV